MTPKLCLFRAAALLPLVVAPFLGGCSSSQAANAEATPAAPATSPAERGEYLVKAVGCNDCHTPLAMGPNGPAPDMTRMLSGHPAELKMPAPPPPTAPWMMVSSTTNTAFYGPWGVSYAINLTSDPTGLASWTEKMFLKAMKTGQHLGDGRMIQPPMPWPAYSQLSDEDIKAIFAYLKTVPPVANKAPEYMPASQLEAPAQ